MVGLVIGFESRESGVSVNLVQFSEWQQGRWWQVYWTALRGFRSRFGRPLTAGERRLSELAATEEADLVLQSGPLVPAAVGDLIEPGDLMDGGCM